ncbi:hypothetical protein [Halopiger goleimassiliensis]|uniref:hypothetical protein n=1 Tax=Halopiger goleimassiliensis TaxID=1293048 RepID=UPI000677FCC3|nr:hypothetical protein [Halopiger goleimassiliensis]
MERRKILLGSGAALATVLAGCSGDETGDESPTDDDDDESGFDDDDDDYGSDDDDTGDVEDDVNDLPGIDGVEDVSSDHLTVRQVDHDPNTLSVVVETDTTDTELLHKELEDLADGLANAVIDVDEFASATDEIDVVVEYDGSRVFAVYIDVDWIVQLLEDELTKEQFGEKVVNTKS